MKYAGHRNVDWGIVLEAVFIPKKSILFQKMKCECDSE